MTVFPASVYASAASAASVLLAVDERADSLVSPGLAGFLVTFGLALATLFLIRSMVKHLRKVRYSPEPGEKPKVPGQRPEQVDPRADPEGSDGN